MTCHGTRRNSHFNSRLPTLLEAFGHLQLIATPRLPSLFGAFGNVQNYQKIAAMTFPSIGYISTLHVVFRSQPDCRHFTVARSILAVPRVGESKNMIATEQLARP